MLSTHSVLAVIAGGEIEVMHVAARAVHELRAGVALVLDADALRAAHESADAAAKYCCLGNDNTPDSLCFLGMPTWKPGLLKKYEKKVKKR